MARHDKSTHGMILYGARSSYVKLVIVLLATQECPATACVSCRRDARYGSDASLVVDLVKLEKSLEPQISILMMASKLITSLYIQPPTSASSLPARHDRSQVLRDPFPAGEQCQGNQLHVCLLQPLYHAQVACNYRRT